MTRLEKKKKKKLSLILTWIGYLCIGIGAIVTMVVMLYIAFNGGHTPQPQIHKLTNLMFVVFPMVMIGFILLTFVVTKFQFDFKLYKNEILAKKESMYATRFMKLFREQDYVNANFYFDLLRFESTKSTMIGFIRGTLYGNNDEKSNEILRGFYEKTYGKN